MAEPRAPLQNRLRWLLAVELACRATGADFVKVVEGPGQVGRCVDDLTGDARKVACWLILDHGRLASREVALASGLHRSSVSEQGAKARASYEAGALGPAADEIVEVFGEIMAGLPGVVVPLRGRRRGMRPLQSVRPADG